MALPNSGLLGLNDIAGEFGGTLPHGLQDYYGVAPGIPQTGLIGIQDFYGAAAKFLTPMWGADSVTSGSSGGFWDVGGASGLAAVNDGNWSTYAEWSGSLWLQTSTGVMLLDFPPVFASEILRFRVRAKGRGTQQNSGATLQAWTNSPGTLRFFWPEGSTIIADYDTDLMDSNLSDTLSGVTVTANFADFIGSSNVVLDWFAAGPRFRFHTSDYNGGGTGGRLYQVEIQVEYR